MDKIKLLITCMCSTLIMIALSQVEGWRRIVPLHSTRADVERLLGAPRESRGVASTYDTKDGKVLIFYSAGHCKSGGSNVWNVPLDTVLSMNVHPNAKLFVHDLKLDRSKNERILDYHVQGIIYYFNKEDGVRISARSGAGEDEFVDNITYEPALKDNHLRCPGAPAVSYSSVDGPPAHKFDEYSNILISDENARLDNFAIYLHQKPKLMGYIIAYAGRRAHVGEAKARAERVKNYLIKNRGIQSDRLVTIDGGHRTDRMVELFITLPGIPPSATPTLDPNEVKIIRKVKVKNHRGS